MPLLYMLPSHSRIHHLAFVFILVSAWILSPIATAQMPGGKGQRGGEGKGGKGGKRPSSEDRISPGTGTITRHEYVLLHGVDSQYNGKANPFSPTEHNLKKGKELFYGHCTKCHDVESSENPEMITYMTPKPSRLDQAVELPVESGTYLFWAISTGGIRFNTSMPRFADSIGDTRPDDWLNKKQIWQIVTYLEKLQAGSGEKVVPVIPREERQRPPGRPGENGPGQGERPPDDIMNGGPGGNGEMQ